MTTEVKAKPRRLYKTLDGKRVPGVTTVLGNVGWKTPGLVWWAFRLGQEYPELASPYDKTEEAADIGTEVHRAVELVMHGLPEADAKQHIKDSLPEELQPQAMTALTAFYHWRDGVGLEVTDTEIAIVSEELRVGGTIDYIGKVNGQRALLDLKTSGGIYPDMWVQVATYGAMWNEAHPDDTIAGYYVLRIDKESGGFDYSYRPDLSFAVEAFKAAKVLHDLKKKLK